MDSQIAHPHAHNYEDDHHNVVSPQPGEVHHEKKSMMKKVRDKAKKIRNTITKHGHSDEHEEEEDDDDDDDDVADDHMEVDHETHGAPKYDSLPMRMGVGGTDVIKGEQGTHLGRSTAQREEPVAPVNTPLPVSSGISQTGVHDTSRKHDHVPEVNEGKIGAGLGRKPVLEVDPHSPKDRSQKHDSPKYQTKVIDPSGAGAEEAGINPILHSFGKLNVHDETEPKSHQNPSFDQHISPAGRHHETEPKSHQNPSFDQHISPAGRHHETEPKSHQNPSFDQHISPAGSHHETEPKSHQNPRSDRHNSPTGSHDQFSPDLHISTKETPQNQSSTYTEKLTYATSALTGGAISAKNAVASKLGYGGGKDENVTAQEKHEPAREMEVKPSSPSQVGGGGGYGSKIASTVTGALSPVYTKVAGAGTTVLSKVTGSGAGTGTGTGTDTGTRTEAERGVEGADKGVSVQQSWTEKLKPGEEDRALSETISDALYKRKEGGTEKPMGKVTESEKVARRLGTGDEKSGEGVDSGGDMKVNAAGDPVAGKGVVNMVKGAVTSWFGKPDQPQPPHHGGEVGHGQDEVPEEKRVHESN